MVNDRPNPGVPYSVLGVAWCIVYGCIMFCLPNTVLAHFAHASDNVEVRRLRELHQKPYKCKQTLHHVKNKSYITATSVR